MKAHVDQADQLTSGADTAATLTPGHTTQADTEDGDYALASKFYNTEIQATKCATRQTIPRSVWPTVCTTSLLVVSPCTSPLLVPFAGSLRRACRHGSPSR